MVIGGYRLGPELGGARDYRLAAVLLVDELQHDHDGVRRPVHAGGAVDQYFSFSGVIAYTWAVASAAVDEAEEAPPPPKRKRKKAADDEESAQEAEGDE